MAASSGDPRSADGSSGRSGNREGSFGTANDAPVA
jgi:hypothetical protein